MVVKKPMDFTPKARKKAEPISFTLYGEEFHAYEELQGSVLLGFAAAMGDEDSGSSAKLILDFFETALKPESFESFDKMIHSKETIVPADALAEIVGHLMEKYSGGRNLPESSDSPAS
jgi:hypothetical protein